ncbi:MAG: amidohydrolase family protein, partial [Melioribacteraceae bacterium]|nr:amidohydrolase family protein [Melioribacteraceae bacterium]
MKITNVWICQVGIETIIPIFGDIEIDDGRIIDIKEKSFSIVNFEINSDDADIINGGGRVVTVSLVNFHDHIYSRLAKGLSIKGKMDNFQNILENLWWKLDLELDLPMIEASAKMAALESIKNGVTYIFDHHASPSTTVDSLKTIAGVLKEFDLRGVLCFETSDRNGDQLSEQALNENINFFNNYTNDDIKSLMGLHASFTLKNETLEKAAQMLNERKLGIHVHLCEDQSDVELSKKEFGFSPVERFVKYNLLNSKSILAHGIHLTENDYSAISQSGSAIVYNLDSNLNNSVGLPDFKMVPSNLPILVGTDGMHANIARS